MRICIATYFEGVNYGSRLQATALAEYFRGKGYEVAFIDGFSAKRFLLRHPSLILARVRNKLFTRERRAFFAPVQYDPSAARLKRLEDYTDAHCPRVNFDSDEKWESAMRNGDIFVSGGDIIWQPAIGYPTRFMLDFVYFTDLTRFSFGSSMGRATLPNRLRRVYRKYLSGYRAVGVREAGTARLLQAVTGRPVEKVVDPTLLLDAAQWDVFASRAQLSVKAEPGRYILCYFVMDDPEYWAYAEKLRAARGLEVIVLPMHAADERLPYSVVLDGTPYEFLWLIKHAAVICTDSLHACIFSLIYKKQFQLLRRARKAEDEKYDDFLSRYHLEPCAVSDRSAPKPDADIDYASAHRQLDIDRKQAFAYLEKALQLS